MRRTISVSGNGKATSIPDMAAFQVGVSNTARTAQVALEYNSGNITAIMRVLESYNIRDKDMKTGGFTVFPEYEWVNDGRVFVGYRVSHKVHVRVQDMTILGEILDKVIRAGGTEVSGISFEISDLGSVLNEARRTAIRDAQGRAQIYANAASVALGEVISISESGFVVPQSQDGYRFDAEKLEDTSSVPVAVGENEVSISVHMVYSIMSTVQT